MATDRFLYLGFLPRKSKALRELLDSLKGRRETLVAYESPYRLGATLAAIAATLGAERRVCVAREISKKFEQFYRGTAGELRDLFVDDNPRGEGDFGHCGGGCGRCCVGAGACRGRRCMNGWRRGRSLSRAARDVARLAGWKKGAVYRLGVERDN